MEKKKKTPTRTTNVQEVVVVPSTIRTIVGSKSKVFRLEDFIKEYSLLLGEQEEQKQEEISSSCSSSSSFFHELLLQQQKKKKKKKQQRRNNNSNGNGNSNSNDTNHQYVISKKDILLIRRFSETLVSPTIDDGNKATTTTTTTTTTTGLIIRKPKCQESLSSLIDDVIWSLVVVNNKNKNNNNILSKGYVIASESMSQQITQCSAHSGMKSGVMCMKLNGNVTYCKTSRYFYYLHQMIGDDLLRYLLLKTRMFVPLLYNNNDHNNDNDSNNNGDDTGSDEESTTKTTTTTTTNNNNNYMMICGPIPSQLALRKVGLIPSSLPDNIMNSSPSSSSPPPPQGIGSASKNKKSPQRKRKRKLEARQQQGQEHEEEEGEEESTRRKRGITTTTKRQKCCNNNNSSNKLYDPLGPNTTINRKSMFYSDSYLPKVGLPKTHIFNTTTTSTPIISNTDSNNHKKKKEEEEKRKRALILLEHMIPLWRGTTTTAAAPSDGSTAAAATTTTTTTTPPTLMNNSNNSNNDNDDDDDDGTTNNNSNNKRRRKRNRTRRKILQYHHHHHRQQQQQQQQQAEAGLCICKEILKRHIRCDYHRLLERYCPLPNTALLLSNSNNNNAKKTNKHNNNNNKASNNNKKRQLYGQRDAGKEEDEKEKPPKVSQMVASETQQHHHHQQQQQRGASAEEEEKEEGQEEEKEQPAPSKAQKQQQQQQPPPTSTPSTTAITLSELSTCHHTNPDNVIAFVINVVDAVFPESFWGSKHNYERTLEVLEIFIKLRRREELPNKVIMKGIRIMDFHWLMAPPVIISSDVGKKEEDNNNNSNNNNDDDDGRQRRKKKKKKRLSRTGHESLTRLATIVIRWFFHQFVIPLLRSNFYITESEFAGRTVLFYRKPVWSLFRSLSMNHLLQNCGTTNDGGGRNSSSNKPQYKEISVQETKSRLENQQMGCSRLRLLPKATGVRPIATLCKREEDPIDTNNNSNNIKGNDPAAEGITNPAGITAVTRKRKQKFSSNYKSTNEILRDAFEALKYEHQSNPSLFGSGLLGLHSFYPRYREFVAKVKLRSSTNPQQHQQGGDDNHSETTPRTPKLYFATVDVRHCYDNIDQDKLLDIVMTVLSEDDYIIHRYSKLYANKSMGHVTKKRKTDVDLPENFDVFHKWKSNGSSATNKSRGAVFLDEANSTLANKDKILALIREHMKNHLVVAKGRHGNRYLLQSKGIPQGSILSTFLCNFYYGKVEEVVIGSDLNTGRGHHLLARIVDDFFLITTDQSTHKKFLQAMYKGEPSWGVHINKDKIFSNVQVSLADETGSTQTIQDATRDQNGLFPWCGMLFDTKSLEVQIDYSRFEDDKAGNNLTVARSDKEGDQLRKAMKTFVRPRCLPILFDPSINSQETRDMNFFDLVLLCAIKTGRYIESGDMAKLNVTFLRSCIEDTILFSLQVIRGRLQEEYASLKDGDIGAGGLDLSPRQALSLGWNAFLVAFRELTCLDSQGLNIWAELQRHPQCSRVSRALQKSPQRKLLLQHAERS